MIFGAAPFASVSIAGAELAIATLATRPVGRPSADISRGGWLPSKGAALYSMINKVRAGANYIHTNNLSTCEIALGVMTVPGNRLRYKAKSSMGNGLVFELLSGGVLVARWAHTLTATDDMYSHTLTSAQVAMMAGGSLTARLTATQ